MAYGRGTKSVAKSAPMVDLNHNDQQEALAQVMHMLSVEVAAQTAADRGAGLLDRKAPGWVRKHAVSRRGLGMSPVRIVDSVAAEVKAYELSGTSGEVSYYSDNKVLDGGAYGFYPTQRYNTENRVGDGYYGASLNAAWKRILDRRFYLIELRERRKKNAKKKENK